MQMLCQLDGHECILVDDSANVVATVRDTRPDLIVLDMFLPGQLGGLDVLRALRNTPEIADIPVLATTAGPDVCTRRDAIDAGANDFLIKPFSVTDWKTAVNQLLHPTPLH